MSVTRKAFAIVWVLCVASYTIPLLLYVLRNLPPRMPLLPALAAVFLVAIVPLVIGLTIVSGKMKKRDPLRKNHLAGSYVKELKAPEQGPGDIMLGFARLPPQKEAQHILIEGSPGSGKSQIIKHLVHKARGRNDTAVMVDTGYDLHRTFARPGDLILSPFDVNGIGWLPINEVRQPSDWSVIANCFIDEGHGDGRQWADMARVFMANVARNYQTECQKAGKTFDTGELFQLLTAAEPKIIEPLLQNTSSATLGRDPRQLGNVRMSLISALRSWPDLKPGTFSIRDWVASPARASIFIPYTKNQLASMRNLISAWLDLFILNAIDHGPSQRRTWLVIDELAGLGEINALLMGAAELRKTGFAVVAALQDHNQFNMIYGADRAASMINNLSNKVYLRSTSADVAERMSRTLGDAKMRVTSRTESNRRGDRSRSVSVTDSERVDRVVIASELMALPDLTAFVKLSGDAEIKKTPIEIYM